MFTSLLRRLLAILVIAGLTAGTLAASAAVGSMEPSSAMAMIDEAMADGMPCCPDDKPALPDCQKLCPPMISCLAKCFQPGPSAWAWDRLALRLPGIIGLRDDALPSGLAGAPPPRTSANLTPSSAPAGSRITRVA